MCSSRTELPFLPVYEFSKVDWFPVSRNTDQDVSLTTQKARCKKKAKFHMVTGWLKTATFILIERQKTSQLWTQYLSSVRKPVSPFGRL